MPIRAAAAGSGPSSNSRSLPSEGLTLSREEVKGAWGEWLSRWQWDWWVTLTYDPKRRPSASATHTAVGWSLSNRHWHEWLAEAVGDSSGSSPWPGSPFWVRGREPNPWRYGTHFHALVGGVGTDTSRKRAWESWFIKHGLARIEPYDPRRGAGYYVSKYVIKELGDITFSPNLDSMAPRSTN